MRKALRAAAALFLLTLTASCSKPEDPIQVDTTAITILNQTSSDWKGVLIVVLSRRSARVESRRAPQRADRAVRNGVRTAVAVRHADHEGRRDRKVGGR
jgi:hypothetical protein